MLKLRTAQTPPPKLNQKSSSPVLAFETLYVTQVDERSDTRVYGYGYRGSVSVNSSVTVVQKVWIRREDGSQDCLEFTDRRRLKVRAGNLLRRAYLQHPKSKKFHLIATFCPETGDYQRAALDRAGIQYPTQSRLSTLYIVLSLVPAFFSPAVPLLLLGPLFSNRTLLAVNPFPGLTNLIAMILFFAILIVPPILVIYWAARPMVRLSKWSVALSRYVEAELRR
jgi:hypothetical protein